MLSRQASCTEPRKISVATIAGLSLIGAFASALPAQATHIVGPAGLPQIRDALAIALPGDLVLVQPGTYAHFTATVGVTIRAITPGTVAVTWQPQYVSPACLVDPGCLGGQGATTIAPPAGQAVHIVGIDFLPNTYAGVVTVRHCVAVFGSTVTFDQCSIQANGATALWVLSSAVHMQDCAVAGSGTAGTAHGAVVADSLLTAIDTAITGNSGLPLPGDGVFAWNSTLHGSSMQIFGGAASAAGIGAPAIRGNSLTQLWICDSALVATNQCPVIGNGATGRVERTTQTGSTGCATLPGGAMLGVDRPVPPTGGGRFTLRYRCDPNALVAVFCGPGLQAQSLLGLAEQPLSLSFANYFSGGVYLTDANGVLNVTWQMPAGAPFVNQPLWFQAVGGLSFPLQVSPIAGGIVR